MSQSNKQIGPLQNLFADIEKIIDLMEVKDQNAADAAETEQSRANAELWLLAKVEKDSYVTYKNWWTIGMFQSVMNNVKQIDVKYYMEHPYTVPYKFQDTLLELGRQAFFNEFEETNSYYRMLIGLPAINDTDYIYLSEELKERFLKQMDKECCQELHL